MPVVRSLFSLLLAFGSLISTSAAQEVGPVDPATEADRGGAIAEAVIAEIEMSEDQASAVRAIHAAGAERRSALIEDMQALRDSNSPRRERVRRMRDVRDELQAHQAATRAELAEVLDEQQMEEFDALIAARRATLRETMRRAMNDQGPE